MNPNTTESSNIYIYKCMYTDVCVHICKRTLIRNAKVGSMCLSYSISKEFIKKMEIKSFLNISVDKP